MIIFLSFDLNFLPHIWCYTLHFCYNTAISFPVAYSPGGVAFEREVEPPDWVLDYWHPLEKAEYPEYFKKREQRKKEFIAMWEKQYGKYEDKGHH